MARSGCRESLIALKKAAAKDKKARKLMQKLDKKRSNLARGVFSKVDYGKGIGFWQIRN
jgi:hypothetical protein